MSVTQFPFFGQVLQVELYRNLALAGACVFFVTLVLIANVLTSLIVFTCVIFTLVSNLGVLAPISPKNFKFQNFSQIFAFLKKT